MWSDRLHPRGNTGFAAWPLLLVVGVAASVIVWALLGRGQSTDGPVEVVWERTACAHCAMHLGDPRFAAQLTTEAGDTYFYDDPGCLFLHRRVLADHGVGIARIWFHSYQGEDWISGAEVRFIPVAGTPMDYGFAATRATNSDGLTMAQAAERIR